MEAEDDGVFIVLPFDPREAFGKARAPVLVTIAGLTFPTTVAVYGERAYIGVRREIRERAGIEVGQELEVEVAPDPGR